MVWQRQQAGRGDVDVDIDATGGEGIWPEVGGNDDDGADGDDGDDGATSPWGEPSVMTARSTFFMANWVEIGWPLGGVIQDGGAMTTAPAVGNAATGAKSGISAAVGDAGREGCGRSGMSRPGDDGSGGSASAERGKPHVEQLMPPGSL